VNWVRDFSAHSSGASGARNLEDAPDGMRQELLDLYYLLTEHRSEEVPPEHLYNVICQSLGIRPSGYPDRGTDMPPGGMFAKLTGRGFTI
jgi:hypothetical protein